MTDELKNCGCDLDGDIFHYAGEPVFINLKQIWHEGYEAGKNEALQNKQSEKLEKVKKALKCCGADHQYCHSGCPYYECECCPESVMGDALEILESL